MGRWGARAGLVGEEEVAEESHAFHQVGLGPPLDLQSASPDAPPSGYHAHKGCLFPARAAAASEGRDGGEHLAPIARRWGQRAALVPPAGDGDVSVLSPDATANIEERVRRAKQRQERRAKARAGRREDVCMHKAQQRAVVWLRDDLRLDDNPALRESSQYGSVVCVFIHDTEDPSPWPLRGAAQCWKYETLRTFAATLRSLGNEMIVRVGAPADVLLQLCLETGADAVMWNRLCEPWYHSRDIEAEKTCRLNGLEVFSFKAAVLWEPWEAKPDERAYNRGFGSVGFYRSAVEELGEVPQPLPPVERLPSVPKDCRASLMQSSVTLESLGYHLSAGKGFPLDFRSYNQERQDCVCASGADIPASEDWAAELRSFWPAGEKDALRRLKEFLESSLAEGLYEGRERFRADRRWTAILSPYIRFGLLSPLRCYHEAQKYASRKVNTDKGPRPLNSTFARRFFWRDLAYWTLWRFPDLPSQSLRAHYETQGWSGTESQLKQWQRGRTGFPLVDAAMRQLWRLGWMPNYLRHVCAQFLIEFLDISWKRGMMWFDYTLVDSDVAINAFMWQNGGHSGLDQWNFVMHPVFAAKSCDPNGDYVRRWVPELACLPKEYIHCPWEAPVGLLIGANVLATRTYPDRVVEDLDTARREHAKEVIRVRKEHSFMVAKGGNEWFEARPGHWVTLITREDFKKNTVEFLTKQTADDPRHVKRRQLQDPLSLVMNDFARQHESALAGDV